MIGLVVCKTKRNDVGASRLGVVSRRKSVEGRCNCARHISRGKYPFGGAKLVIFHRRRNSEMNN